MFKLYRPRGLMDKASDFGSEDWGFESLRGRILIFFFFNPSSPLINKEKSICCSRLKEKKCY